MNESLNTPEEVLTEFSKVLKEAVEAINDINNNLIELNHLIATGR